jgi:DNA-binding NarL/FixJ family response regulator
VRLETTKILIADDHALIREGLRRLLWELDGETAIIEARDWVETMAAAAAHPDLGLALIDLRMPGKDGLTALAELLRLGTGLPVLVFSASENVEYMRVALRLGAMGYVGKCETSAVMLGAVRLVLAGGMYVPPALANLGIDNQAASHRPDLVLNLTERQLEVLRLIVAGKSNKEIAQSLHLAHATVKVHLAAIFRALEVENRTQAAIAAERLGLSRAALDCD